MDHIAALERLARLKADGALTVEEFNAEKAKLLNQSQPNQTKSLAEGWEETAELRQSMWSRLKWQMLVLILVFGGLVIAGWYQLQKMTPEEAIDVIEQGMPQCASPEIKDALRSAIEESPASKLIAIRVLEIANIEDRGFGANPPMRYCAADITTNDGEEHIGYTIRASNENADEFIIETGPDVSAPVQESAEPATVSNAGNRAAQTHVLTIDDQNLKNPGPTEDGPSITITKACLGDKIIIRNNASIAISPTSTPLYSDNSALLDPIAAGGSFEFQAEEVGSFVITAEDHQGPWLRYDGRPCAS